MPRGQEIFPPRVGVAITGGTLANRPSAGTENSYYWATDRQKLYRDNGTDWEIEIGSRGDYTYLVEVEGSNITVYDNKGSVAHGPSTDADVEINWALANLTAGRTEKETVKLLGEFTTDDLLLVYDYTYFDITEARVTLADNSDCNMIENEDQTGGNSYIEIIGGILDGNKANQATGHGISLDEIEHVILEKITILDAKQNAFNIRDATAGLSVTIENCRTHTADVNGFWVNNVTQLSIKGCFAIDNAENGYHLIGGFSVRCTANCAVSNDKSGFYLESQHESIYNDCTSNHNVEAGIRLGGGGAITLDGWAIYGNGFHGIWAFASMEIVVITASYIYDNGQAADNTYDDIYVQGERWVIDGNLLGMASGFKVRYGVFLNGADACVVSDNSIYECRTDGIHLDGATSNIITGNRIHNSDAYGINIDAASIENSIENNFTSGNTTACLRINNANCVRNMITNNQFDEGNISDVGGGHNCRAWLNYDPSANVFITTINPPTVVGGGGGALP